MNLAAFQLHALHRFNLPAALLVMLLQRTPVLRLLVAAEEMTLAPVTGHVLKSAFAVAASLGAIHSLAGATVFQVAPSNPVAGTVGQTMSITFTYTGAPTPVVSWRILSSPPPGLTVTGVNASNIVNTATPIVTGVPTQAGTFILRVQGYDRLNGTGETKASGESITFNIAAVVGVPAITGHPQNATVTAGGNATFTVTATGNAPLAYQWRKDGTTISGATTSTYALTGVTATAAGAYSVVVSNSLGSATSNNATLTVNPLAVAPPTITAAPRSLTIVPGGTVALQTIATGAAPLAYQWRKGGVAIAGATDPQLILNNTSTATAGDYTVAVTNPGGTVTSAAATIATTTGVPSRLANLSVRASVVSGKTLIVGFATNDLKSILVRAIGPGLSFLFPSYYADPALELYNQAGVMIDANDNWNSAMAATFTSVGAFELATGSKDAALMRQVAGAYTAQLKGTGANMALVEVYDAGGGMTPRLINVSARNFAGTGNDILIAGFVVDGVVAKTLLIRGVGPTIASFVPGALVDPKLTIVDQADNKLAENDNWSTAVSPSATQVGAFDLTVGSKDAALLITLPPGSYTAQVSGADGGTGEAVVEVYEVP
ncbi:MAG: immunoglobulin domain-containing protein [Opitutae bacterium]|nr:immunoglobulin domain-containing protein [Opitutae bacterium]